MSEPAIIPTTDHATADIGPNIIVWIAVPIFRNVLADIAMEWMGGRIRGELSEIGIMV